MKWAVGKSIPQLFASTGKTGPDLSEKLKLELMVCPKRFPVSSVIIGRNKDNSLLLFGFCVLKFIKYNLFNFIILFKFIRVVHPKELCLFWYKNTCLFIFLNLLCFFIQLCIVENTFNLFLSSQ